MAERYRVYGIDLNPDLLDVAREHMAAAVRRCCARRGIAVTAAPLVAYGGAAGQHGGGEIKPEVGAQG